MISFKSLYGGYNNNNNNNNNNNVSSALAHLVSGNFPNFYKHPNLSVSDN